MNKSASPLSTSKQKTKSKLPEYKSNPFAVSFRGFELLVEYAKSIFIVTIIFGVLGLGLNLLDAFTSDYNVNEPSSSTTIITDDSYSNQRGELDYSLQTATGVEADNLEDNLSLDVLANTIPIIVFFVVITAVVVVIAIAALSAVFGGVAAAGAIAAVNKKKITFMQAVSQMGSRYTELFKAYLLVTLKVLGGYLLLIVPGIRAQLRYEAVPYILMDNPKMSARDSLAASKKLYQGHLMEMFGITFVAELIPVLGVSFGMGGKAMSYKQIAAYQSAGQNTPKTHWLNYLPFIVFTGFFVLGFLLAALLFTVN